MHLKQTNLKQTNLKQTNLKQIIPFAPQLANDALQGFNGCVYAYGGKAVGKTGTLNSMSDEQGKSCVIGMSD
jgi:hypothetical protein